MVSLNAQPGFINGLSDALGTEFASRDNAEIVRRALPCMGVDNPEAVQLRALNPILERAGISSMNFNGNIWLNEDVFSSDSNQPRRWYQAYVEAAQLANGANQKLLRALVNVGTVAAVVGGSVICAMDSSMPFATVCTLSAMGATTAAGIAWYLPRVLKEEEKKADLLAAETLIIENKKPVVEAIISELEAEIKAGTPDSYWSCSTREKITYLRALIS